MTVSAREKMLLLMTAALLISVALYQFGWRPLQEREQAARARLALLEAFQVKLSDLRKLQVELDRPEPEGPLLGRVSANAERHALPLRQLVPVNARLQVTTGDVTFGALLRWLDAVTREEAVRLVSVRLTRQTKPGIVVAALEMESAR